MIVPDCSSDRAREEEGRKQRELMQIEQREKEDQIKRQQKVISSFHS